MGSNKITTLSVAADPSSAVFLLKCSVAQQGMVTASEIASKKTDFFNRLRCLLAADDCSRAAQLPFPYFSDYRVLLAPEIFSVWGSAVLPL
jgi:hypothetical protein